MIKLTQIKNRKMRGKNEKSNVYIKYRWTL